MFLIRTNGWEPTGKRHSGAPADIEMAFGEEA